MATISRLNVEVGDTETEIIESTATVTSEERIFGVGNGDKEITATAWGLNDEGIWVVIESKIVTPKAYEKIILGINHYFHVKLTGRTNVSGEISFVDGFLTYTAP
ncbi:MAG: hypothetical protein JSV09_16975 [Thermoplasmata archaeon]|nr:MAG: hypothetical protein JSV09_16975 [Thermoplasmata archaeon]